MEKDLPTFRERLTKRKKEIDTESGYTAQIMEKKKKRAEGKLRFS